MKNMQFPASKFRRLSRINQLKFSAFLCWLSLKESIEEIPARYVLWQLARDKKTALPTASAKTE